jgi:hypothetical protein
MPIRFKTYGGGWSAPVGNGKIKLNWGGPWNVTPSVIYRKMGDVGGGYWLDTGYRGAPGVPSTPAVYSWPSYNYMTIYCHGSTVGAPAVSFDLLQMDSAGNWLAAEWGSADTIAGFYTNPDGYYIYVARATAASGLVSGWSGQLRVRMGHGGSPIYGYTKATEGWANTVYGPWAKDQPAWMVVPGHVTIYDYVYNLYAPAGNGWCSPAHLRYLHHVFYNNPDPGVITLPSPVSYAEHLPASYGHLAQPAPPAPQVWEHGIWGAGWNWGIVTRGDGWGWWGHPDGEYHHLHGSFGISGLAHYDVYSVVGYTADTPNGYW